MNGLPWLEGIFGTVRCASCGASYGRDDVSVVGNRDEYWFVRCACHACGTHGVGVVIVKEASVPPGGGAAPALGVDDVLLAHELLATYDGDVRGLFAGGPRMPER